MESGAGAEKHERKDVSESLSDYGWFPRNEKLFTADGDFHAVEIETDPPAAQRGRVDSEEINAAARNGKQNADKTDVYETARNYVIHGEFSRKNKTERGRGNTKVVFIVDSSGSMALGKQISHAKKIIGETVRKNKGNVMEFSGVALYEDGAQIFSPPAADAEKLISNLTELKTGGRTNMSAGIVLAGKILKKSRSAKKNNSALFIFTDGRINSCETGKEPFEDSVKKFKTIIGARAKTTVVDTEASFVKIGAALKFSEAIGAKYTRTGKMEAVK
ncbi:MAG: VWA domain-containing protein [Candidatus Mycalebacterium zealandia]|nr:MAG: VWA domain-containing protein [Candidatus Mycalebacterium zealandia]